MEILMNLSLKKRKKKFALQMLMLYHTTLFCHLNIKHSKFICYYSIYKLSINTELVAGQQCVKYVCKYVMKGATMAFVRMQQEGMKSDAHNPPIRYDEFHQIRLARYITSMEAYLSLIGLPLVKRSHVVCISLT